MPAATELPVTTQVDAALDQVQKDRERVLAARSGPDRSARMAELYEIEAKCWAVLFEHSRSRVYWRAALSAREYARDNARNWRDRAATEGALNAGGTP